MFTGLTLGIGEISRRKPLGAEVELTVTPGFDWASPLELGESVAVSGVCLTVTNALGARGFMAHASAETLAHSTLGTATRVNLERALPLGGRLGGHLVSGHADGLATVRDLRRAGASVVCTFGAAAEFMPYIAPKGSVCIDGVSLTVNEVSADAFTVNLIPHTAGRTTLGLLRPGDTVNLETDLIAKYLQRLLTCGEAPAAPREGLSLEFLAKHGF